MPSFDVISEVDKQTLTNAVDQANRTVETRFDFKGVEARFERSAEYVVTIVAEGKFQASQMADILSASLIKNKIDISCLDKELPKVSGMLVKQDINVRNGLDSDSCKKVVKLIKNGKFKVQAQIQGEQVRVTGKKRDDLQQVMAMLRGAELDMPVQFDNFRN
ncbi:MAG: YajQ family cyclic di-GMP-binding protein [Pseudomonadales bacterium]|nr:YajQ family cyclic di-GMP-binding protein [Pseudomonadales bacterium]